MMQWCWWDRRAVCSMSKAVITLNRRKTVTISNRRKAHTFMTRDAMRLKLSGSKGEKHKCSREGEFVKEHDFFVVV
jgi:hypothetical protein